MLHPMTLAHPTVLIVASNHGSLGLGFVGLLEPTLARLGVSFEIANRFALAVHFVNLAAIPVGRFADLVAPAVVLARLVADRSRTVGFDRTLAGPVQMIVVVVERFGQILGVAALLDEAVARLQQLELPMVAALVNRERFRRHQKLDSLLHVTIRQPRGSFGWLADFGGR